MRAFVMCLAVALSFLIDTIIFTRLDLFGIRPDTLLILVVVFSILGGASRGVIAGVAGGLAIDIMFGRYIGLTPLMYLIVGVLAGVFYQRFYSNNILLPAFVTGAGIVIKEALTGLFLMLIGSEFNFALMLVRYIVPTALMSAGISIPLFLLFRYLFARQTKRGARYE